MLRLLHTADVHLGARHTDLGDRAAALRERQFAAFKASVDLAIAERVDLFLVAGDLFDSNTQPRRSVERVAAELGRLAAASVRAVLIPGTHDVYDGASIYRSYDLAAMAAAPDWIAVLTPDRPEIVIPSLDAIVYGRVFATKRAPVGPLAGLDARTESRAAWRMAMVHGALSIPGRTDADEVVFTAEEIAATGLDYLALGHWHNTLEGRAGGVTYAYPGSPEPVALDQAGAGNVLLVTLDERNGQRTTTVEARKVGRTTVERIALDAGGIHSQPDLVQLLSKSADPDRVLDVRLTGLFPDDLDLDTDEVERQLAPSFLRVRLRNDSIPAAPEGIEAPPDTVLGAFVRNVQARIDELEGAAGGSGVAAGPSAAAGPYAAAGPGAAGPAAAGPGAGPGAAPDAATAERLADLREVLRLGRHLLEGREVTL